MWQNRKPDVELGLGAAAFFQIIGHSDHSPIILVCPVSLGWHIEQSPPSATGSPSTSKV